MKLSPDSANVGPIAAYLRRHILSQPNLILYDDQADTWCGLPAMRLHLDLEMWLVPLYGHTRGHCGVAFLTDAGWWFHLGDAAPVQLEKLFPAWIERLVLGEHVPALRIFQAQHPEMHITTGQYAPGILQESLNSAHYIPSGLKPGEL